MANITFDNKPINIPCTKEDLLALLGYTDQVISKTDETGSTVILHVLGYVEEPENWVTYATGGAGHGTVVDTECATSGRIVTITQTETPPSGSEKRIVITGWQADYASQYSGDFIVPMDSATLCQGIRPGFWDDDIYVEVGAVGASLRYGNTGTGENSFTVDFDSIALQYKEV